MKRMTGTVGFEVDEAHDGERLDRAIEQGLPGTSLRFRRRIWETGTVLVQGVARRSAYKVRSGMRINIVFDTVSDIQESTQKNVAVCVSEEFGAVFKPGNMHSAVIAGKPGPSVEAGLGDLFPGRGAVLLTRLDYGTSGLLLVAFGAGAETRFREWENRGEVEKRYLALVRGDADFGTETVLKGRLDMDGRRKTRLLPEDDTDPVRWTVVRTLCRVEAVDGTLVAAVIRKGARHQIRTHLAGAGYPIVGDALYGDGGEGGTLYLHHARVSFPGFEASAPPQWDVPGLDPEHFMGPAASGAPC